MLTPLTDADPRSVGPYRLQNRIGSGGMGTVYLGFTAGQQAVAVKIASAGLSEDEEFRTRFCREVRAAQRVRGRAVASVLDADTDARQPWLVTEYVEGMSLIDAVRARGPLEAHLVRGLAVGLADALVAIHEAGVIHRDLKPSNILLAWDGPKVIDFGIAHLTDAEGITQTGTVIGTLAWMAPEQMRGDQVTSAADVFAWATCVAFAATGRHPFHAETAELLARRVQDDEPDVQDLPDYLAGVVPRSLAKNPRHRPRATDLMATLVGRPVHGIGDADHATGSVLEQTWTGHVPQALRASAHLPPPPPAESYVAAPQRPASEPAAATSVPATPTPPLAPAADPVRPVYPVPSPPLAQQQPVVPSYPYSYPSAPLPPPFGEPPFGAQPHQPARNVEQHQVSGQAVSYPPPPGSSPFPRPGAVPRQSAVRSARPWNTCAALSLVFGVTWVLGIGSVLAVVLGYVGRSQAKARGERGAAMAKFGIVLGWLGIVGTVVVVIAASAATKSLRQD